jgi:hypothetical protein
MAGRFAFEIREIRGGEAQQVVGLTLLLIA